MGSRRNRIVVEIADTSIGIPEDQMEKVLEPFGQVETSLTRRREGSGLGLPLAKALTEIHGGSFAIASTVSIGTRVRFALPHSRIVRARNANSPVGFRRGSLSGDANDRGWALPRRPGRAGGASGQRV